MKEWTKYLWDSDKLECPTPAFYEVDLTNRCNLNCPWCCTREARLKNPVDMSIDLVYRIIDKAFKLRIGVVFSGGGEPTLHPNFKDIMKYATKCLGVGLVSNGTNTTRIREYLEIMKNHKNFWVRLSLNARPINDRLWKLFKEYPGQIGISIIDVDVNVPNMEYPAEALTPLAKAVRKRLPSNEVPMKMTPQECIGRKFETVFEADGTIAWCCQARGLNGKPPDFCFADCRWSQIYLKDAWKDNPWT